MCASGCLCVCVCVCVCVHVCVCVCVCVYVCACVCENYNTGCICSSIFFFIVPRQYIQQVVFKYNCAKAPSLSLLMLAATVARVVIAIVVSSNSSQQ